MLLLAGFVTLSVAALCVLPFVNWIDGPPDDDPSGKEVAEATYRTGPDHAHETLQHVEADAPDTEDDVNVAKKSLGSKKHLGHFDSMHPEDVLISQWSDAAGPAEFKTFDAATQELFVVWDDSEGQAEPELKLVPTPEGTSEIQLNGVKVGIIPSNGSTNAQDITLLNRSSLQGSVWAA